MTVNNDPWIMTKKEKEIYLELRKVWDDIEELGISQGLTWEKSQERVVEIFKDFKGCKDIEKDYWVVNEIYKMFKVRPKFRNIN